MRSQQINHQMRDNSVILLPRFWNFHGRDYAGSKFEDPSMDIHKLKIISFKLLFLVD